VRGGGGERDERVRGEEKGERDCYRRGRHPETTERHFEEWDVE